MGPVGFLYCRKMQHCTRKNLDLGHVPVCVGKSSMEG